VWIASRVYYYMQYEEDQKHYLLAKMVIYFGVRTLGIIAVIILVIILIKLLR
jgi:hypothetical protein